MFLFLWQEYLHSTVFTDYCCHQNGCCAGLHHQRCRCGEYLVLAPTREVEIGSIFSSRKHAAITACLLGKQLPNRAFSVLPPHERSPRRHTTRPRLYDAFTSVDSVQSDGRVETFHSLASAFPEPDDLAPGLKCIEKIRWLAGQSSNIEYASTARRNRYAQRPSIGLHTEVPSSFPPSSTPLSAK